MSSKSSFYNSTGVTNTQSNAIDASVDNAEASAVASENSANNASSSASTATTKASEASTSASTATTKASEASTSASTATTKAGEAATSATASANSATASANSATASANSAASITGAETNAANSAISAATSATAASASKDAALAALDNFDDRYLGVKSSNPTVDNDGNALVAGSLYFNSTDDTMKVYEGSTWVAAYASLSGAVLQTGSAMTGDLSFGDNDKAIFGAGSDLQIYHDGTTSIIKETGSGDLRLQGANIDFKDPAGQTYAYFNDTSGAVDLYHNNSAKLATSASGISVSGTVVAHKVEIGNGSASGTSEILFSDNASGRGKILYDHSSNPETMLLQTTGTTAISIDNSQNVSIPNGNLGVTGTVTSAGLTVDGGANSELRIDTDAAGYLQVGQFTNGAFIGTSSTNATYGKLRLGAGTKRFVDVGINGDISFYEDTGTTAKFFWDSSAESLGIGTSNPSGKIHSVAANNQVAVMAGGDVSEPLYPAFGFDGQIGSNGGRGAGMYLPADGNLAFSTSGSEAMRINSSGRQTYNGSSTANGHANFVGEVGTSYKALAFEHTNGGGEVGSIRTTSSTAVYYGDGSNLTGVGGGGGSWELISTTTVGSNVSSVDFTGLSGETYYKVVFKGLQASSLGNLQMRVFRNSVLKTNGSYRYVRQEYTMGMTAINTAAGNYKSTLMNMGFVSNASNAGTQGEVYIYDTDAKYSTVYSRSEFADSNDNTKGYIYFGTDFTDTTNTLTGLRFHHSSGSFSQGTFSIYSLVTS